LSTVHLIGIQVGDRNGLATLGSSVSSDVGLCDGDDHLGIGVLLSTV